MPDHNGYARCPVCGKERQTTGTGRMINHNMWNGKKMVKCGGSMSKPSTFRKLFSR
jgi:hypothetical protein